jgi:hypothetical protein
MSSRPQHSESAPRRQAAAGRLAGRGVESAHDSIHQQDRIERIDRRYAAHGEREQQQRAEGERGITGLQDTLPRDPVGGVAGDQEKKDAGQELSEAYQA